MIRFLIALLVSASTAQAADFPAKPVRFITGAAPGSTGDVLGRVLGDQLSTLWKQTAVIDNRPGGGGVIASQAVLTAAPDGHTVFICAGSYLTITPSTTANMPYDVDKDFTPLAFVAEIPLVIGARPDLPYKTIPELIAYAKANPGKVTFGSAGNGSSNHLSGELLKVLTKAPMEHVPYKGSGPAMTDVIAGNITCMFDVLITSIPQMRAGRIRALAVTSAKRSPYVPEVPSMEEAGVAGYNEAGSDLWFGIVGPAGIPKPIVLLLNAKLIEALRAPDMRERIRLQAFDLWTSTPEEFSKVLKADRAKWGKIVSTAGARID
jgi:tripartite-type tricarboxylate transporter receptor subunit TctC